MAAGEGIPGTSRRRPVSVSVRGARASLTPGAMGVRRPTTFDGFRIALSGYRGRPA